MLSIRQRTNVGLLSGIYFQRPFEELKISTSQIRLVRPTMVSITRIDELGGDANRIASLPYPTLQHRPQNRACEGRLWGRQLLAR